MSMLPSSILIGPAAVGLMSNSKISVGSHTVAHAFGMSTTPLMCPCTGAAQGGLIEAKLRQGFASFAMAE